MGSAGDHDRHRDRSRDGEAGDAADARSAPPTLGAVARGHLRPLVAGRTERRQRLEPRGTLVQPLELIPAGSAALQVLPGRRVSRLGAALAQPHQRLECQVCHKATSSPSHRRSRTCARASCDLEKLGVLPIIVAISSWVYPSTS